MKVEINNGKGQIVIFVPIDIPWGGSCCPVLPKRIGN